MIFYSHKSGHILPWTQKSAMKSSCHLNQSLIMIKNEPDVFLILDSKTWLKITCYFWNLVLRVSRKFEPFKQCSELFFAGRIWSLQSEWEWPKGQLCYLKKINPCWCQSFFRNDSKIMNFARFVLILLITRHGFVHGHFMFFLIETKMSPKDEFNPGSVK